MPIDDDTRQQLIGLCLIGMGLVLMWIFWPGDKR